MQRPLAPDEASAATSRPARCAVGCVCLFLCLLAVTGPAAGATGPGTVATAPVAAGTPAIAQQEDCFGSDTFEAVAGGTVEFSSSCGGYILVGGDKTVDSASNRNFLDLLYVSGGSATVTVNTRLLGTDQSAYSGGVVSYTQKYGADTAPGDTAEFDGFEFVNEDGEEIAGTLAEFNEQVGITRLPRPVQPARYRLLAGANESLVLGDDGVPYLEGPLDRSNLRLTKPGFEGDLGRSVAPKGAADEDFAPATDRTRVAVGDRVRISGFSTAGFRGTFSTIDAEGLDRLRTLLDYPEGVNVTIEHLNPGVNQKPEEVTFDSANARDLFVDFSDDDESFSMVIDTSKGTWFGARSAPGDRFRVTYAFEGTPGEEYRFPGGNGLPGPFTAQSTADPDRSEQYPYFDGEETTVESTTTFTVVEPRIEYSQDQLTSDGALIVGENGQYRLTGTTTYAPGTDVEIQLISRDDPPPTKIRIDDVSIGDDGSFRTPAVSFAELDPENPVEAELFLRDQLVDRRPVVIAADPDDPAELALVDATSSVTITEGESLSALAATAENTGVADGTANVRLRIDGDLWGNRTITVTPDRNRTVAFDRSYPSLPPGEYPYTVRLAGADRTLSGTLVIEPGGTPEPTVTAEPDRPDTTRPPTATSEDTPQSPPTRTATATVTSEPTTAVATNGSAPEEEAAGSPIGGLVGYVTSVLPFTLGSMVFVILAYVIVRAVVARRGGSESAS
ncbi:hypothetical protein [Halorientalis pallida]|uniref:Uncharacterized protein n=1 Tax=Halorientalis pallida TaxID=2479928 RepID=A0A498KVF6_9EURY|nr:hypothetical protein [Halorientalis pallida]RXK48559.1 hypothetical protein EAF64_12840 [Halorientalis pallida]